MDIRGRCCPGKKGFNNCGARIDTMCWFFENDSECYNLFEKNEGDKKSKDKIIFQFCSKYKMTSVSDKESVCKLYWDNQKENRRLETTGLVETITEYENELFDLRKYRPNLNWGFEGIDTTEIYDAYDKFHPNLRMLNTTDIKIRKLEKLCEETQAELFEYQKQYHTGKYFNTEVLTPGTRITCLSTCFTSSCGLDYVITTATRTKLVGYFICGDHTGEVKKINTRPNLITRIYMY